MPQRGSRKETAQEKRRVALSIVKTLQSKGFKAYWAGGCVRDMIMGVSPTDYDIATDARPDDVMSIFKKTVPVGERFGVVLVIENTVCFEVATFRGEGLYKDGRHPEDVHFEDEVEDVKRRDFTINGLLYDPITEQVIDYVKGKEDIDARLIRTIGDPWQRFSEDNLRILRAVRFAAALGFEIEKTTREAIEGRAGEIINISRERIRDEIMKILMGPSPRYGFELMHSTGLLGHILPEVESMVGIKQPPEYHPEGDVFIHTMLMLELMEDPSEELALGVLLHDIGKPGTFEMTDRIRFNNHNVVGARLAENLLRRLRFSNKTVKGVVSLVKNHLRFMNMENMRESKLKRFIKEPNFKEHLELHRLDCLASHGDLSIWNFCIDKMKEYDSEVIPPPPIVTGHDLINLGFSPGPLFSEILSFIQDLQIEGKIETRKEALELIEEKYEKKKRNNTEGRK
ncbi:MAG: CCA tRNA nucleotidyltransferase [Candidatus Glassbacteria bacterium]